MLSLLIMERCRVFYNGVIVDKNGFERTKFSKKCFSFRTIEASNLVLGKVVRKGKWAKLGFDVRPL